MIKRLIFYFLIYNTVIIGATNPLEAKKGNDLKDDEKIIKRHLLNAQIALHKCDFDKALVEYQSIVKKYPNSEFADDAQLEIGRCLVAKKNFTKAIEEFKKVIALYPNGKVINKIWYEHILPLEIMEDELIVNKLSNKEKYPPHWIKEKDYEAYCAYYQNVPNYTVDSARLEIAKLYIYNLKDYKNGIEELKKIITKYPDGERVSNDQKFALESKHGVLVKEIHRPEKDSFFMLGMILMLQENYNEAINYYKQYIKIYPLEYSEFSVVHKYLGDCYVKKKRLKLALREYEMALELEYRLLEEIKLKDEVKGIKRNYDLFKDNISYLESIIKELKGKI